MQLALHQAEQAVVTLDHGESTAQLRTRNVATDDLHERATVGRFRCGVVAQHQRRDPLRVDHSHERIEFGVRARIVCVAARFTKNDGIEIARSRVFDGCPIVVGCGYGPSDVINEIGRAVG